MNGIFSVTPTFPTSRAATICNSSQSLSAGKSDKGFVSSKAFTPWTKYLWWSCFIPTWRLWHVANQHTTQSSVHSLHGNQSKQQSSLDPGRILKYSVLRQCQIDSRSMASSVMKSSMAKVWAMHLPPMVLPHQAAVGFKCASQKHIRFYVYVHCIQYPLVSISYTA